MSRLSDILLHRLHRLADGELRGAERRHVEDEIAADPAAQAAYEEILRGTAARKDALGTRDHSLDALRDRISDAMDEIDGTASESSGPVPAHSGRRFVSILAGIAATAALVALGLFLLRPTTQDATDIAGTTKVDPLPVVHPSIVEQVAADVEGLHHERWSLDRRSSTGPELEAWFAEQGIGFPTRIFDLAMMEFRLDGGVAKELGGHPSAAFAYQGPAGARLLCQMYPGDESELPDGAEVVERNGITFYSYDIGCVAMTFWREGDVLCVLASMLDREQVLNLAIAKAEKA